MIRITGLAFGLAVLVLGTARAEDKKGVLVDLGGLSSHAPADWKEEQPTGQFRSQQFRLPKHKEDKQDSVLAVFYFGENGAGSSEENIKRKKNAFIPPEGKKIDEATKIDKFRVGNAGVIYVDIQGTYKDKKGPFVPDSEAVLRADYRMLYVIFESPKGPYYLQIVGPAKSIEQSKKGFDNWLKAFK
jgi:hypothetical protein